MMAGSERTCPGCGSAATRKDGRDRRGRQRFRCGACRRRFTALTGTPFSGYRFPPDVIALAVRWYLRFRLSYADVAELLAERGVRVDPSTVYAWVREFAPLYEDAARPFRRAVGSSWSVDETYAKVAGKPAYVYRAIDGQGQVVDVYVSAAARDRRRGGLLPPRHRGHRRHPGRGDDRLARPPTRPRWPPRSRPSRTRRGSAVQQRIERDHQHLQGAAAPDARLQDARRGAGALPGARLPAQPARRLLRLSGSLVDAVAVPPQPPVVQAWAALTGTLLGR